MQEHTNLAHLDVAQAVGWSRKGLTRYQAFGCASFVIPMSTSPYLPTFEPKRTPRVRECKVVTLRECPTPESLMLCDTPQKAFDYWQLNVATNPYFNADVECFAVLLLNTRRRVKAHQLVSMGTHDTILVSPLVVFRLAVVTSSPALIVMHNHPSGDPTPSEADIRVTKDLMRAGQFLKIDLLDHLIVGKPGYSSLRELGYLYQ